MNFKHSELLFIAALFFLFMPAKNVSAVTSFTEEVATLGIHKSSEDVYKNSIKISDDKKHIVYVSGNHNGKVRVWIDGIAGESYAGVSDPVIAPVTNRVGYIAAQSAEKMLAVIDGKRGPVFEKADSLVFSPDGSRFAYRAMKENGMVVVVVDNNSGPEFTNVRKDMGIIFSPDSRQFAYVAVNAAGSQVMVKDHKPLEACKEIASPIFSPDSKHFAYAARFENGWSVICDGKRQGVYDNVANILFSPDSESLAYMAERNKRLIVVKDGKELFSGESAGMPFFSPCSNMFGYIMKKGNGWHVVVNGQKGPAIARPDKVAFSDDCSHFAYSALIGSDWATVRDHTVLAKGFTKIRYMGFLPGTASVACIVVEKDGEERVLVDDKKGPPYDSVGLPVAVPGNPGSVAYVASEKGKGQFLVIDGKEQKPYKHLGIPARAGGRTLYMEQQPFFSPDGSHVAYPARDEKGRCFMVVDGKTHEYYDALSKPVFSPDGKHLAYTARKNNGWLVVVDGIEGKEMFAGVVPGAEIVFDSPSSFYVLMMRMPGPQFCKLKVDISGPEIQ